MNIVSKTGINHVYYITYHQIAEMSKKIFSQIQWPVIFYQKTTIGITLLYNAKRISRSNIKIIIKPVSISYRLVDIYCMISKLNCNLTFGFVLPVQ